MARKEDNPNQIVRIDGNKCFMEALKNAFEIKKVQMNFYQYDVNRPKGDRYTAEIPIYIDFKDFDSIFYEIMIGGSKIKEMNRLAADPNKKQWEKQLIIYRGGFEKDGQIKARQLKIFKGMKKPIVLRAEIGKGQKNDRGGYSMVGQPERYIDIGMENKDLEVLMLECWKCVNAFEASKAMNKKHDEIIFEMNKLKEVLSLFAKALNIDENQLKAILEKEQPKPTYNNDDKNNSVQKTTQQSQQTYQNTQQNYSPQNYNYNNQQNYNGYQGQNGYY